MPAPLSSNAPAAQHARSASLGGGVLPPAARRHSISDAGPRRASFVGCLKSGLAFLLVQTSPADALAPRTEGPFEDAIRTLADSDFMLAQDHNDSRNRELVQRAVGAAAVTGKVVFAKQAVTNWNITTTRANEATCLAAVHPQGRLECAQWFESAVPPLTLPTDHAAVQVLANRNVSWKILAFTDPGAADSEAVLEEHRRVIWCIGHMHATAVVNRQGYIDDSACTGVITHEPYHVAPYNVTPQGLELIYGLFDQAQKKAPTVMVVNSQVWSANENLVRSVGATFSPKERCAAEMGARGYLFLDMPVGGDTVTLIAPRKLERGLEQVASRHPGTVVFHTRRPAHNEL